MNINLTHNFTDMTQESPKSELTKLISDYEEHRTQYFEEYDEIAFRQNIINRFFKIFGWDVYNEENLPEYNRDVIIHPNINGKRPDYAFGLLAQWKPLFFVEAKTPATVIKDHKDSAHQIRRYGRSAGLAISILTNFEEFAVYDCTKSPRKGDSARNRQIKYFKYTQYIDNFDFLWDTFSKESVKKGKLEKYIQSDTQKKGSVPLDKEFVEKLNEWRRILATNIGRKNKRLLEEDINYSVQLIIDRIIFLRFCEDKNIEHFGNLKESVSNGNIHQNLVTLYKKADEKYNSGLFDFEKDSVTPNLKIDNKILKNIIDELYRPKAEYEYGVMPVEILGNAYEQFLGNIIRMTPSRRAKIVPKPEVKKAKGVYYTPQYIVEYIVENTIGTLLKGKTPKQIEKIKIVDPACGSGSFLLGAFVCLLKHHSEYYWNKGFQKKKNKSSIFTPDGKLTVAEKKKILTNNLFGVDIDSNAVEVTKLSLLLKAMEGETEESIYQQQKMFHDAALLPNLDNNIKCGNSIVGNDFFDGSLEFEKEERKELEKKLKPFDWKIAFPEIFRHGGFDAVIGNPPWVSLSGKFGNNILEEDAQKYLITKYNANTYMPNLYEYFVNKGLELVKKKGYFSFIVPDRLGFNEQFINLRKKVLNNFTIEELLYKANFPNIVTDTLIFRFYNAQELDYKIHVGEFDKELQTKKMSEYLGDNNFRFSYEISDIIAKTLEKIFTNRKCKHLEQIIESTSGFGGNSEEITDKRKNKRQIKIIKGRSIQKYFFSEIFYFEFQKKNFTGRTTDIKKLGAKEKVLLRKTGYPIFATYDSSKIFPEQSLYFLFNNKTSLSLKYITGLINSKLFQFCFWHRLVTNRDSTPQLKKVDLDRFPVFIADFNKTQDKLNHNEIVRLVDTLLDLNKDLRKAKRPDEKDRLNNRIAHSENRIDELVYELYGLTKKEISTIERNLPQ